MSEELPAGGGTLYEPVTGPVSDWATDFDHTDSGWVADPYPIWDDLRQRCPVAHSNRYGGVWLPTRYDTSPRSPKTPSCSRRGE